MAEKSLTLKEKASVRPNGDELVRLRAQIAETRNEMTGTIEELHGRLNPKVLKEQALDEFHEASEKVRAELKERFQEAKDALSEQVDNAKDAVRDATIGKVKNMMQEARNVVAENPIPAALAGLGLAWLFVASRRKHRELREGPRTRMTLPAGSAYPYYEEQAGDERSTGEKIRDVARETGQKVSETGREATDAVKETGRKVAEATSSAATRAKETVRDVAHRTGDTAVEISHKAQRQARRVRRRSSELYRDNPIAVGAGMIALGTIAGLAIPRTRAEDKLVGGARDEALEKAEELAHKAFQKAGDAVERFGTEEQPPTGK